MKDEKKNAHRRIYLSCEKFILYNLNDTFVENDDIFKITFGIGHSYKYFWDLSLLTQFLLKNNMGL